MRDSLFLPIPPSACGDLDSAEGTLADRIETEVQPMRKAS